MDVFQPNTSIFNLLIDVDLHSACLVQFILLIIPLIALNLLLSMHVFLSSCDTKGLKQPRQ